MSLKKSTLPQALDVLKIRVRPPLALALGAPSPSACLLADLGLPAVCYQMDLYQADRLRQDLAELQVQAEVATHPDVWDLPDVFQTVLFPATEGGDRELKIDLVDQAFHILRPGGCLVVVSPYDKDQLFPGLLKKIYGEVHATRVRTGTVFWAQRHGDRPRRRHEMTYHARLGDEGSRAFLSRPGVFAYGRLDDGARGLLESMTINSGEQILDLGCGAGTNGIFAGLRAGPEGGVNFMDSNVRATALAAENARSNGLTNYRIVAAAGGEGLPQRAFDVVLANPPYYAHGSITRLFAEQGRACLRKRGRFYLVTKQVEQTVPILEECFETIEAAEKRGYVVFSCR
jgi:16S rRNA (guanine1207-N2)-methyltransferase